MKPGRLLVFGLLFFLFCIEAKAEGLTYLVHSPKQPADHPPLIMLLHGAGADERDMIGLWAQLPPAFVVVSPRAPIASGTGYVWYRKAHRAADLAMSRAIIELMLANAVQRFGADPHRVFLAGFSQGAVMTYEVALRDPARLRGAAVLSGSLLSPGLAKPGDWSRDALFIAHGVKDDKIPFQSALATRAALASARIPFVYHAYEGMGHTISAAETQDLSAWLTQRLAGPQ